MDSFVVSQNNLKRMSYAKCVTLLERGSHAVRFSFMPGGEVTGLKTYRGPKRKQMIGVYFPPVQTHCTETSAILLPG